MTVDIKQDVFRLHIAINQILIMHILEPQKNLTEIKPGRHFVEHRVLIDVEEELPAGAEVDQEIVKVFLKVN